MNFSDSLEFHSGSQWSGGWPLSAQHTVLGPRSKPFSSHSGSRLQCVWPLKRLLDPLPQVSKSHLHSTFSLPRAIPWPRDVPSCIQVHRPRKEASYSSWKLTLAGWKGIPGYWETKVWLWECIRVGGISFWRMDSSSH